jgi:GH18 family chitinase
VPEISFVSDITHVAIAFMRPGAFNIPNASEWPLFTTVEKVRSQFASGTAIMVAVGGWGDTAGFSAAAKSESSRKLFAQNIRKMLHETGADGEPE